MNLSQKTARQKTGQSSSRSAQQPVTAHRLFPALVALWLAALLGLGSFAVPASLIEDVLVAAHVSAVVPSASPPIGLTARLLIAMVMALAGIVGGVLIALRLRPRAAPVARRRTAGATCHDPAELVEEEQEIQDASPLVRAFDAHPDAPPRRPFDLSEALPYDYPQAGSSLAETPLGENLVADEVADPAFAVFGDGDTEAQKPMPVHEMQWVEAEWSEVEEAAADHLMASIAGDCSNAHEQTEPLKEPHAALPLLEAGALHSAPATSKLLRSAPLESLGLVQLIERLALAMEEHRCRADVAHNAGLAIPRSSGMSDEPAPDLEPACEVAPEPEPEEAFGPPTAVARQIFIVPEPAPSKPVSDEFVPSDLSGVSGEMHGKETLAALEPIPVDAAPMPAEVPSPRPLPRLFGMSESALRPSVVQVGVASLPVRSSRTEETVKHSALISAASQSDGDDDEEVVVPRFLGGLARSAGPVASPYHAKSGPTELSPSLEAGSLPSSRQNFSGVPQGFGTDIAEEGSARPVVVFPGQGSRSAEDIDNAADAGPTAGVESDAQETERALRAALATLQRMTARG